jgi:NgoFVII-like restriction endonuclease
MVLLPTEKLLGEFEKRVTSASRIDIAVAWVGPSPALELLRAVARKKKISVSVAVGLSGNSTIPEALRSLQEFATVRIAHSTVGIFHPKFYLFQSDEEVICWIGSANFTLGGFVVNSELVNEFADDGPARKWFEGFWDRLNPDPKNEIDRYIAAWKRPPGGASPTRPLSDVATTDPLKLLLGTPLTWREYVDALRVCDAYWKRHFEDFSVFDEERSWIETIATGADLIQRNNWAAFTTKEVNVLIAYKAGDGAWGLLGTMGGAGQAVGKFLKNQGHVREKIRKAIAPVIDAVEEKEFVDAAVKAIDDISELNGFGPAIATRLITLARPDRGVSVNKGSAPGLAKLAQLPATPSLLANARNYPKLLQWVYEQPWYSAPYPDESLERTAWKMRAALIDSFVYKPI